MATCCSISSSGTCRCWALSRRRMWPRWRSKRESPRWCSFFGAQLAKELAAEGRCADLVLGNNVLAQVPDLNDFVEGLKILLKPDRGPDAGVSPPAAADRAQRV